jgi:hypothetical protein
MIYGSSAVGGLDIVRRSRVTSANATLSTTNLTLLDLGSNLGRLGGNPVATDPGAPARPRFFLVQKYGETKKIHCRVCWRAAVLAAFVFHEAKQLTGVLVHQLQFVSGPGSMTSQIRQDSLTTLSTYLLQEEKRAHQSV